MKRQLGVHSPTPATRTLRLRLTVTSLRWHSLAELSSLRLYSQWTFFNFLKNIVDLQYCIHFRCIVSDLLCTYMHFLYSLPLKVTARHWVKVKVTQCCLILCNSMDCIVHGILQARILEWVAYPFSRWFSQPRDRTQVSHIAGGFFTSWVTREVQDIEYLVFYGRSLLVIYFTYYSG